MNIYVGNLARQMSEDELKNLFAEFGNVTSVSIIKDRFTGESRGFGFVEMDDDNAANQAISALNNKEVQGRNLRVNQARPKGEKKFRSQDRGFRKNNRY